MIILAIETSCDETAVALSKFYKDRVKVLSNIISSQIKMHSRYGGVVPSLASRMHLKNLVPILSESLRVSRVGKSEIDYVAVARGPGLIPSLTIGVSAAKALSYALEKPLIGISHIEGHIYANWLKNLDKKSSKKTRAFKKSENLYCLWHPKFPVLCLVVSGGHTQLVLIKRNLNYEIIGETLDDAVGEAFDKVAKLLNLGYPGGPAIEKAAKKGNKNRFKFTRPMMNSKNFNFSFSGLKTAVLYEARSAKLIDKKYKCDMSASFQQTVIDVLINKTIKAAREYRVKNILLGGGVSANEELRMQFQRAIEKEVSLSGLCLKSGKNLHFPIPSLTTDNALMIAVAAYHYIVQNNNIKSWKDVEADANLRLK